MKNSDRSEIFGKCLANEKLALDIVSILNGRVADQAIKGAIKELADVASKSAEPAAKAGEVREIFARLTKASRGLAREVFLRRSDLVATTAGLLQKLAGRRYPQMHLELVDIIVENQRRFLELIQRIQQTEPDKNRPIDEDDVLSIIASDTENNDRLLTRLSKA